MIYTFRRWWDRYRLQVILSSLALGSALAIRQTGASFLLEAYQAITRPFQPVAEQERTLATAQMQELQQRLLELESQNQRLRELAGDKSVTKQSGIPAPVIGRSADHWWHQFILGRGSTDGIKAGDVVAAPGGVVGRVIGVTNHASRVLLLSDPTSRVGVTVTRSRVMGYLRGQSDNPSSDNRAVMEFFDKVPDVKPGDVIATSSVSQLFPAGMPIGRVESLKLDASPAPLAVIRLTAPVGSLEWVNVYSHGKDAQVIDPANPGVDLKEPDVAPPVSSPTPSATDLPTTPAIPPQ